MNNKFSLKDLFANKKLKGLFPQFKKQDKLQNVYSFEWVERKISEYICSVFDGKIANGEIIIIKGKFKSKFKQIKALKTIIEDLFNNMPAITKNMRKNTKLITPFQSVEQLQEINDTEQKMVVMQIVLDNLNYNPDFQSQNRFSTKDKSLSFYKRQELWMAAVDYYKFTKK